MAEFVEQNPSVTFEFIASERFLDLMKGEADIAIRISGNISDERLIARKVGRTQWTYYASRSYVEKNGAPDKFSDDMEPHRLILLSHVSTKRSNVLRCVSADDARMAIRTGQGVGALTVFDGDRDPELIRCFDPPEGADLSVWLVTSPEARKRDEVRRFTAFAADKISQSLKAAMD